MFRRLMFASLVVLCFASPLLAAQDESVLVENPVEPQYQSLSADALRDAVTVRSSRSYAMFGYNVPEIVVQLPEIDNSVYAKVKFDDPVLENEAGETVEYEREDGIYDHETHSNEIRMTTPEAEPVTFAIARGTATVRYPARIRTTRVGAGAVEKLPDLGLAIEGRKVRLNLDDSVPEEASFAPIKALRAYDGSGRMIEREGGWSGGMVDGVSYRDFEYRADVASVELDQVEEWIGLSIEYEVRPSPMRAPELAGTLPDPDPLIAGTDPGKVSVSVVQLIAPSVLGYAADLSREEIVGSLGDLGYRSIDDEAMVRAATESNAEAIQLLLAAGISPDAMTGQDTALLRAASFAEPDVIELLIRAGADVNAANEVGSTPLIQLSNRCTTVDVSGAARAMIDAGADINSKAKGGATALMMADVMQCADLASMYREAGAKEWK